MKNEDLKVFYAYGNLYSFRTESNQSQKSLLVTVNNRAWKIPFELTDIIDYGITEEMCVTVVFFMKRKTFVSRVLLRPDGTTCKLHHQRVKVRRLRNEHYRNVEDNGLNRSRDKAVIEYNISPDGTFLIAKTIVPMDLVYTVMDIWTGITQSSYWYHRLNVPIEEIEFKLINSKGSFVPCVSTGDKGTKQFIIRDKEPLYLQDIIALDEGVYIVLNDKSLFLMDNENMYKIFHLGIGSYKLYQGSDSFWAINHFRISGMNTQGIGYAFVSN